MTTATWSKPASSACSTSAYDPPCTPSRYHWKWRCGTRPASPCRSTKGSSAPVEPIEAGARWGAPWGTSWFRVTGTVPQEWAGKTVEAILDLGFDENMPGFQCEGLVYRPDGTPVKGLNPRNQWVRIGAPVEGGEEVRLHVEAASNPVILDYHPFRPTQLGDKETAGSEPQYKLERMDLAVLDETVWQLVIDLEVLGELMAELPVESARRWDILRAVEKALDAVDLQDVGGTAAAARSQLEGVLSAPAVPSAHRISAVGHAHIDSAWLWPLRETVRKVARTTSNMTALLEDEPDFVFAMSQAQQWAWVKEHRPEVWARVKKAVADGRFVPAGGMWVESDTNMPGSEAMARQFVHGKRFFLDEFGVENEEAWLPDTFGFAAGLPQIIKAAGSKWLLTQKISWSQTNKFPHHTFQWEGIDGTRIFTHFPPVDTYNCSMKGSEIAHAARNFKDKGVARHSLAPTGWGDGGGGTTREMVAKAARLRDLEGSATVVWETPEEFFEKAEAEYPNAARLGRRAVPRTAPRHPHQPGQDQAGQPAQRTPPARGRTVGGDRGRARPDSPTRTRSWTGSGRRSCCTSSTTSCPARPSPGCTARPAATYERRRRGAERHHRLRPARAGR